MDGIITISTLIQHLKNYQEQFGDIPCFLALSVGSNALIPMKSTFIAELSKVEEDVSIRINVACVADFDIKS